MALRDDLKILAPEIASSETDPRIDFFLDQAALSVNRTRFGSRADLATILLAAHFLTRFPASGGQPGAPGGVTTERIGDLSVGYANLNLPGLVAQGDVEYMTTTYGARYVSLRKSVPTTPLVV
jgi:hypothetical protein